MANQVVQCAPYSTWLYVGAGEARPSREVSEKSNTTKKISGTQLAGWQYFQSGLNVMESSLALDLDLNLQLGLLTTSHSPSGLAGRGGDRRK